MTTSHSFILRRFNSKARLVVVSLIRRTGTLHNISTLDLRSIISIKPGALKR